MFRSLIVLLSFCFESGEEGEWLALSEMHRMSARPNARDVVIFLPRPFGVANFSFLSAFLLLLAAAVIYIWLARSSHAASQSSTPGGNHAKLRP